MARVRLIQSGALGRGALARDGRAGRGGTPTRGASLIAVTASNDEIASAARDVLEHIPEVEVAVLFGSWARSTPHARSDVDIGVVWRGAAPPLFRELAVQGELERATGREVDLVDITSAPPPLRWRIARDGTLLLARDPGSWTRLRVEIAIEHDDLRETTERALALQQRRLLAGGTR